MADRCIVCEKDFCSELDLPQSRAAEHQIPLWLIEFLGVTTVTYRSTTHEYGAAWSRISKQIERENRTSVYIDVCRSCNGGWMRRLEGEVAPILKPLATGDRAIASLNEAERERLARWLVKTAFFVSHLTTRHDKVTPEQIRYLWRTNTVPPGIAVFGMNKKGVASVAVQQGHQWVTEAPGHELFPDATEENPFVGGYKVAFTFGSVVLMVAHWSLPGWRLAIVPGLHVPLYPPGAKPVHIPSSLFLTDMSEEYIPTYFYLSLGATKGTAWRAKPAIYDEVVVIQHHDVRVVQKCYEHELLTLTILDQQSPAWNPSRDAPGQTIKRRRGGKKHKKRPK